MTKPHWTLRVVSDQSRTESIDVTKDTERIDQIKAMKKAWELDEPGRYAKVTQRFRALGFLVITLTYDLHQSSPIMMKKWFDVSCFLGFTVACEASDPGPTSNY